MNLKVLDIVITLGDPALRRQDPPTAAVTTTIRRDWNYEVSIDGPLFPRHILMIRRILAACRAADEGE